MMRYGDMPTLAPALLLLGYSMVLGLYFALFGWAVLLVRQASGSRLLALAAAPVFWAALELAASRITSVPWDQLGYSQVDNALVNQLAPFTGVYGISFLLVAVNALLAAGVLSAPHPLDLRRGRSRPRHRRPVGPPAHAAPPRALGHRRPVQPNLDVSADNSWRGPGEWDRHIAEFTRLAGEVCKTYIAGIPPGPQRQVFVVGVEDRRSLRRNRLPALAHAP